MTPSPDNTLIERMLHEMDMEPVPINKVRMQAAARVLLEAMREPSREMINAAIEELPDSFGHNLSWRAMLAAFAKENDKGCWMCCVSWLLVVLSGFWLSAACLLTGHQTGAVAFFLVGSAMMFLGSCKSSCGKKDSAP